MIPSVSGRYRPTLEFFLFNKDVLIIIPSTLRVELSQKMPGLYLTPKA